MDRQRIGGKRRLERHDAIEPRQKQLRLFRVERESFRDLDELAPFETASDPLPSIRGDPDKFLAFLPLAISEIVGHATLDIRPLSDKVALGFEDRPADQRIEAAAHLGDAALEIEGRQFGAKFLDQQLPEVSLDLVMAGFAREMPEKFYRGGGGHKLNLTGASRPDNPAA